MKKKMLLSLCVAAGLCVSAQEITVKDFTDVLIPQELEEEFLPIDEANFADFFFEDRRAAGTVGTKGDFNNDGIEDFILSGPIWKLSNPYMYLYLGQKDAMPIKIDLGVKFPDGGLKIGGGGALDCYKQPADGRWIFAIQGGSQGYDVNPMVTSVFTIDIAEDNSDATVTVLADDIKKDHGKGCAGGSIAVLDVNKDGFADVLQMGFEVNGLEEGYQWATDGSWLWVNDGEFNFTLVPGETGEIHRALAAAGTARMQKADLNGDGLLDIVVGDSRFAKEAAVYLNSGESAMTKSQVLINYFEEGYAEEEFNANIILIDFDGDGLLDVVHNSNIFGRTYVALRMFKNLGDGQFEEIETKDRSGNPMEFRGAIRGFSAVADFDGDGHQDFIMTGECPVPDMTTNWPVMTLLFLGDGQGQFDYYDLTADYLAVSGRGEFGGVMLTGDFDGTGSPDLVLFGSAFGWEPFTANLNRVPEPYTGQIFFNKKGMKEESFFFNPQTSKVSVSTNGGWLNARFEGEADVKLYSATGQLIEQKTVANEYSKKLNKGIYLLSVQGETNKVIIQ